MAVDAVPVEVTLRGSVGGSAAEYARAKVASALAVAHRRVLLAHVVLDWREDPAVENPALAEVSADVNGELVRAKTAAPTTAEAVDDLEDRLRRRLVQLQDRSRTRQRWTGIAGEHEWRHGDLPRHPLHHFPRPVETREVVRHKSFASSPMTADEAAYEMELLDHDFFLFRDAASGLPALVHRRADGGYGVQGAGEGSAGAATREPGPAAISDVDARARLETGGEPFVFYVDAESGAGRVLYHRYDGHYGLIELAGPGD